MKGILIDPGKKSVETLEGDFESEELHKLIGGETLDFCHPFGKRETLCVDDEGMAKELPKFFVEGYQWPIWGRAVLLGRTPGGGTESTHLSVEEVYEWVRFL